MSNETMKDDEREVPSETCACGYSLETSCNVLDPTCKRNAAQPDERAALYTMDQMRDYALAFHEARIERRLSADANETLHAQNVGYSDGYAAGFKAAEARAASPQSGKSAQFNERGIRCIQADSLRAAAPQSAKGEETPVEIERGEGQS